MIEQGKNRVLTILYVEDNAANTRLIAHLLRSHYGERATLLTASDGARGLELARANRLDLILLDIGLPGMDGFEVLRRLRADEVLQHIPVFAVTARALPEDAEDGIDAGFDRYLTKPISVKELIESIDALIANKRDQS